MAHAVDPDDANHIGNFINHPVVTSADAPVVFAAGELAAANGAWIGCECLNGFDHAVVCLCRQARKVFLGGALKQDTIYVGYLVLRAAR